MIRIGTNSMWKGAMGGVDVCSVVRWGLWENMGGYKRIKKHDRIEGDPTTG